MAFFDALLDRSVFFSFDRSGFQRHAAGFIPGDLPDDLGGQRILITGANGGLGLATAAALRRRGAELILLCRDLDKARRAVADLQPLAPGVPIHLHRADLGDLVSVQQAALEIEGPIHALIHNAGLLPDARRLSPQGVEQTVAVHLLGPLVLTAALLPNLRAGTPSRVIWVSSGGMYGERLDLGRLGHPAEPYDGVAAYARSKRAQVVLAGLLHARLHDQGIEVASMHPGWADTPGVLTSLPTFHRFTAGRLRSPAEGADTIVWLAAAPRLRGALGGFWFDRSPAPLHLLPWTAHAPAVEAALWDQLHAQTGLDPAVWGP